MRFIRIRESIVNSVLILGDIELSCFYAKHKALTRFRYMKCELKNENEAKTKYILSIAMMRAG